MTLIVMIYADQISDYLLNQRHLRSIVSLITFN